METTEVKIYEKVINDKLVRKPANRIIITTKNGGSIFNPTHEMLIEDGWELFVKPTPPEPTAEELLQNAKKSKVNEILTYDSSEAVNEFFMQGISVWLDKATRAGLMLRFQSELALKKQTTILWYNNMNFELSLNDAMTMLYVIENYASQCYDNTQLHIANVNELTSIDDVESYDYTVGYPDKLNF